MRLNLFWKLGLAFFALLIAVLLPVDYYAERTLRRDYERAGFERLTSIARVALSSPPPVSSFSTTSRTPSPALREWLTKMASSGVRVTVITSDGLVLADSQSDPQTMENHAGRPEIREALANGDGLSIRHSVSINGDLLYYAARFAMPSGPPIVLRFAVPLLTVNDEVWAFRRRFWLSSVVMLLVTGMASLLISRTFSRRVERLQSFSRRVAEGDFRPIDADRSGDALEALAVSLNDSATRLDRAMRTLREERNLSAAILGSMVEGVAVVNSAERLLFANEGFVGILELDSPPQPGRSLVEVVRQTELIEAVRDVLKGAPRVEAEIVTGTLRQRFFAATVASVKATENSGAVVVLHDITDLRKLERVRRDFVANVSHEFKTPLTAIQGFAETLLSGAMDDPQNRVRFLQIILEHSRRLARLTDDLLELSKMDADRLALEVDRVSASQLV
ncbi:MAG: PAS domain-containing protein, partial [Acidobacteria bacterium Pan2503]|nr:PAS domain-containing protein [Candidatus Acidoferrum panamensis]